MTPTPSSKSVSPTPDGCELIARERRRQVSVEGWTAEHDDEHKNGEMADAAACYALTSLKRSFTALRITWSHLRFAPVDLIWAVWPEKWDEDWWKPSPRKRVRELVKAGALIAAEIDRLQRKNGKAQP